MRFSERQGYRSARSAIQTEGMDDALRNALWNAFQRVIWDSEESYRNQPYTSTSNLYDLLRAYWGDFFRLPIDRLPEYTSKAIEALRKYFFEAEWFDIYDLIEFTATRLGKSRGSFANSCNEALEREMSGFRLVDCVVTPITSPAELDAIDEALRSSATHIGANAHLMRALELLSDRHNPDYRNSIKESISAVEAIAQSVTNNPSASLGDALRSIASNAPMHPALNRSLSSLYGYTSDASGIRHALLDEPTLDFVDAKFMLAACSAFVNYIVGKAYSPKKT